MKNLIKTEPLITVIIVVYNAENSIEQTIINIIDQTYRPIELIIIDGASNDGTVNIIKKFSDKIKFWVSEPDKGIYDAMNKGWAQAENDSYILFLGAGDKILKLPNMALHPEECVIYGNVLIGNKVFRSTLGWRSFLGNSIHHQAMLIKKSIHPNPPFSIDLKIYGDFDFNQRLIKSGVKFCKDPDFYGYALEGGVSAQVATSELLKIVRKNHGLWISYLAWIYYKLQKRYGFRKNNNRTGSL